MLTPAAVLTGVVAVPTRAAAAPARLDMQPAAASAPAAGGTSVARDGALDVVFADLTRRVSKPEGDRYAALAVTSPLSHGTVLSPVFVISRSASRGLQLSET